jgi:hypothetical protein
VLQTPTGYTVKLSGRLSHLSFDGGDFDMFVFTAGARWK